MFEGYYIETRDRLFFAIKGFEHPPDRWIGVLRYAPDTERGDRINRGESYRRLYRFSEQEEFIEAAYPLYRIFDPVFQITVQSVPRSQVQRIFNPSLRLQELAQTRAGKEIEKDAIAFARLLWKESSIPWPSLGITGSLLIGLHTELSDVDIAVFGMQHCRKVYQTLRKLLDNQTIGDLCRLDIEDIKELYVQRAVDTRMTFDEFAGLEMNKVNQGRFRGRTYFIRFIKEPTEAGEAYGNRYYTPLGRAAIRASIADDQERIFTPCRYLLSDVQGLENAVPPDLDEIVSFRGRFCEQAQKGDSVIAWGTLECVQNNQGETRHRLLIGNSPKDLMTMAG